MSRSKIIAMALGAAVGFVCGETAHPCSCVFPPDALTSLAESDATFRGTVAQVEHVERDLRVTFSVTAVWKGPVAPTLDVFTADNGATCGVFFEVGAEYVVYAYRDDFAGTPNQLSTHLCTRTPLAVPKEESIALGPPCAQGAELENLQDECLPAVPFRRADTNGDGDQDVANAVFLARSLFTGGDPLICLDAADVNDSGDLDVSDVIAVVEGLFLGVHVPPPFLECGIDETADRLGCLQASGCG